MDNLVVGRLIETMTAFFAQWLERRSARMTAVAFFFLSIVLAGLWTGAVLDGMIERTQLLDLSISALYAVTALALFHLFRKQDKS